MTKKYRNGEHTSGYRALGWREEEGVSVTTEGWNECNDGPVLHLYCSGGYTFCTCDKSGVELYAHIIPMLVSWF